MSSRLTRLSFNHRIPKNHKYLCRHFSNEKVTKVQWPRRVFSGIQPTGAVHIGNYFGAIRKWTRMQNDYPCVMFSIVDLHSITLPQNPAELSHNILELTATLLACGIEPTVSVLFLQSTVPQHTQLCWQLACLTTMARLSHLPQFKEKSVKCKEVPLGLFIYPVLQAADILVHKATHIPVGEDQLQHLQMAQQLVKTFNYRFGVTFPSPKAIVSDDSSCRIKSLRNPVKKMSKSDEDPKSRINLTDTPEEIKEKIKKAVTDFTSEVTYDPETRPGVSNLLTIHSLSTGKTVEEICTDMREKGLDTGKYKLVLADVLSEELTPIRERIRELMNQPDLLRDVLQHGCITASESAKITLDEVYEKVGTFMLPNLNQTVLNKSVHDKLN